MRPALRHLRQERRGRPRSAVRRRTPLPCRQHPPPPNRPSQQQRQRSQNRRSQQQRLRSPRAPLHLLNGSRRSPRAPLHRLNGSPQSPRAPLRNPNGKRLPSRWFPLRQRSRRGEGVTREAISGCRSDSERGPSGVSGVSGVSVCVCLGHIVVTFPPCLVRVGGAEAVRWPRAHLSDHAWV